MLHGVVHRLREVAQGSQRLREVAHGIWFLLVYTDVLKMIQWLHEAA